MSIILCMTGLVITELGEVEYPRSLHKGLTRQNTKAMLTVFLGEDGGILRFYLSFFNFIQNTETNEKSVSMTTQHLNSALQLWLASAVTVSQPHQQTPRRGSLQMSHGHFVVLH